MGWEKRVVGAGGGSSLVVEERSRTTWSSYLPISRLNKKEAKAAATPLHLNLGFREILLSRSLL